MLREVRRVLRPDGSLWLNLGDCYVSAADRAQPHLACRACGMRLGCVTTPGRCSSCRPPPALLALPQPVVEATLRMVDPNVAFTARPVEQIASLKLECVDRARLTDSAEPVTPERLEPVAVADRGGKLSGDKDSVSQRLAESLDARDLVDRRADHREVEAIDGADVAVEHLADVQGEIDVANRFAHRSSRGIEPVERPLRLRSGIERFTADPLAALVPERKVASMPSPINFSTWPPRRRSDAVRVSNTSFSSSTTGPPAVTSAMPVNPRTSAYHNTARRLSAEPRSIAPE